AAFQALDQGLQFAKRLLEIGGGFLASHGGTLERRKTGATLAERRTTGKRQPDGGGRIPPRRRYARARRLSARRWPRSSSRSSRCRRRSLAGAASVPAGARRGRRPGSR